MLPSLIIHLKAVYSSLKQNHNNNNLVADNISLISSGENVAFIKNSSKADYVN